MKQAKAIPSPLSQHVNKSHLRKNNRGCILIFSTIGPLDLFSDLEEENIIDGTLSGTAIFPNGT